MVGSGGRDPREDALAAFLVAIAAVEPGAAVRAALRRERLGPRVWVAGAGKAACAMASAAVDVVGDALAGGVVVTKHGHGRPIPGIDVREGGHPVPDEAGRAGARAVEALLGRVGPGDLLLCLWSGGASALLPLPRPGLALDDLRRVTEGLLASGAAIHEVNTVRRHLVALGGGGVARRTAGRIVALVLSDVIGDDLAAIASGPTAPDPTTWADVDAIVRRRGLLLPDAVAAVVAAGLRGAIEDTAKPGEACFARVRHAIVATNALATGAARAEARRRGWRAGVVTNALQGEAREVGAAIAREVAALPPGTCRIYGGETTVTLRGDGKGGRNQELALAAALAAEGTDVVVLAAGTDGTDGPTDAAGGLVDGGTASRARAAGLDPRAHLDRNDAWTVLHATGDLVETGPTGTNVMDVVIALRPERADPTRARP